MNNTMNRDALTEYIKSTYEVTAEYPWQDADHAVYRHADNRKWFAVAMTIQRSRLGLSGDDYVEVVNLKCPTDMLDWLWHQPGIFPAYHMNKNHWISAALDGTVSEDTLAWLVDISFELTKAKKK